MATSKTIAELEAAVATAKAACDTAETARRARYATWLEAYRDATARGRPPGTDHPVPSEPVEDWPTRRSLSRRLSGARAALTRARRALDPAAAPSGKRTLRVTSEFGTFERQTSHLYTHLVIELDTAEQQRKRDQQYLDVLIERETRAKRDLPLVDATGCFRTTQFGGGYYPAHELFRQEPVIATLRTRLAEGHAYRWVAARWSHTLRAALAGRREIHNHQPTATTEIIEVATGQVVRG